MTTQPPAFQFYPADFLADGKVAAMTAEEVGVYVLLLCYAWREGELPNDLVSLARLGRVETMWMEDHWHVLEGCFTIGSGGGWKQPRLERQREEMAERRERSRRGGIASAEARAEKYGSSNPRVNSELGSDKPSGSALHVGFEPNVNTSSSSSSSSSTTTPRDSGEPGRGGVKKPGSREYPQAVHEIAQALAASVLAVSPQERAKPLRWLTDIDRMLRLDDRSEGSVRRLVAWLPKSPPNGTFPGWGRVIRSGACLRKHFAKAWDAMEGAPVTGPRPPSPRPTKTGVVKL